MRALIIEDSAAAADTLRGYLREVCPEIDLAGEAGSVGEAREQIRLLRPDLIFLDIQLRGGTGFDLLQDLDEAERPLTVFITAHGSKENAVRALEFSALDFIEKPFHAGRIREAVDRALARRQDPALLVRQLAILFDNLRHERFRSRTIAVPTTGGAIELVPIDDVIWIESDAAVCYFHLESGARLSAMRNIGHFRKLLVPDYEFFLVSQKALVHLAYVKRYDHREQKVYFKNGEKIDASRRYGAAFRDFLLDRGGDGGRKDLLWRLLRAFR